MASMSSGGRRAPRRGSGRPKPIGRPSSTSAAALVRGAIVVDAPFARAATAALDPHAERHVLRVHPGGEDVAALDAEIVVRAFALEHRPVRVLLHRRAAVEWD